MCESVPPETIRKPRVLQHLRQNARILDDLLLIDPKVARQRFAECHRLGRDHVHQRAALQARETPRS